MATVWSISCSASSLLALAEIPSQFLVIWLHGFDAWVNFCPTLGCAIIRPYLVGFMWRAAFWLPCFCLAESVLQDGYIWIFFVSDAHSILSLFNPFPRLFCPLLEVCGKCGEALSRTQPAVRAMNKLFHSNCFCCMSCHRPLQGMQFYDRDGSPECEDCYMVSRPVPVASALAGLNPIFYLCITLGFFPFGHASLLLRSRVPWQFVPDVRRRSQIVCWRPWASVSMLIASAVAPALAYWRGRRSLPMTTTTLTASRTITGNPPVTRRPVG